MKMRVSIAVALLSAVTGCAAPSGPRTVETPNVIVFLADDMGYGDLRVYDPDSRIPTPTTDRLARSGLRFTDAHAAASACSPSRYALLTGRYAWRIPLDGNLVFFDEPLIEPDRLTLPEMLRQKGYSTAAIGKWHLGMNIRSGHGGFARASGPRIPLDVDFTSPIEGGPLDVGFDYYFGQAGGMVRAFVENRHFVEIPRATSQEYYETPGWEESEKDAIELAKALDFVVRHRRTHPDRPFFLYYASHAPHGPFRPAAEIGGRPVAGQSNAGRRGDLVVQHDAMLEALLGRLDELSLARETLIFVTSDNGARRQFAEKGDVHSPNGDLRGGKAQVFEGGHRVPLIVRWGDGTPDGSRIVPGRVSDALVGLQDLMATLAELVGYELPPDSAEDSESFMGLLLGDRSAGEPRTAMVHHGGRYALREGKWKFIDSGGGRAEEHLFDLTEDLGETTDLIERHPDIAAVMSARLREIRRSPASARRLRPRAVE
jgi:arylsulfatase A-like enzyme